MTQDTKVDWGAAIEAVHEDGRVVPVKIAKGPDYCGDYRITEALEPGGQAAWFCADGTQRFNLNDRHCEKPWRIRNVPTPTNEVRERMEAIIRTLAAEMAPGQHYVSQIEPLRDEARAIVALLDPVDGDLIEARELGAQICELMKLPGLAQSYREGCDDKEALALRALLLDLGMPK